MAVKKLALIAIFAALLAASYLYLSNSYNINTLDFYFSGELSRADLEVLRSSTKSLVSKNMSNKALPCILNYRGDYRGSTLIMTTGMDTLITKTSLLKGRWLTHGDIKEAVLGDKAADRLFRSTNALGQTLRVSGEQYRITGIVRNSSDIYISYNENQNIQWNKKSISFVIKDQRRLYLYSELLEGKLKALGVNVLDTVVYREQIVRYLNILLLIVIVCLLRMLKRIAKAAVSSFRLLMEDYKLHSRVIELHKYLLHSWRKAVRVLLLGLLGVGFLGLCIGLIRLIKIPPSLLPDNLFAPSSYINMIRLNVETYIGRLQKGITGLLLQAHIIDYLLLIYIGAATLINKKERTISD